MRSSADSPRPGSPETAYPPLGRKVEVAAEASPEAAASTRLHVLERGRPDAPALVLIHGASGNLRDFAHRFAPRLAGRFRVVAIDRPGFGHSERRGSEIWRPDRQAQQMRRVVAALGVGRAILLGHSLGAASALAWALDAPETVAGVVVVAGVSHPWPGTAGRQYEITDAPVIGPLFAAAVGRLVSGGYARREAAAVFRPQSPPEGYLDFLGVELALRPATFRANAEDIARLKPLIAAQAARYPSLAPPLEIVHGLADRIVPAAIHAAPLARAAPGAVYTPLEGIGHMPHHTALEAVEAAVDRVAARAGLA